MGEAVLDRGEAGGGGREEGLEQECAEEDALSALLARDRPELDIRETCEDVVLRGGGSFFHELDLALAERVLDLVGDVLLEPADKKIADLLACVVLLVCDRGRLEQVHEARETLGTTVVGRGRGEDEGVARQSEEGRKARPLGLSPAHRHMLALVHHHHVPAALLEVAAVFFVPLQRVDGDDDPVEVVERVHVGRDPRLHPLDAYRVKPDQRDGEPPPQLLLKLGENGLEGDHENPVTAPPLDKLREEDAHLDRLAEANAVRHEDPWAELAKRLRGRLKLVLRLTDGAPRANVEGRIGGGRAAEERVEVEASAAVLGRVVGDEGGLLRPELPDLVDLGEEDGLFAPHELREAHDTHRVAAPGGRLDGAHHPLLIADLYTGSGGGDGRGSNRHRRTLPGRKKRAHSGAVNMLRWKAFRRFPGTPVLSTRFDNFFPSP